MTGVISRHQVIGCLFGIVVLLGGSSAVAEDSTPRKVETVVRVNDERLLKSVEPLGPASFKTTHGDARTRGAIQNYYDSVLDWGRVLRRHFQSVPGHPDWGYYGDGDHKENSIRAVCYAVCTNAFLAEIEPPTARLKPAERDRFRGEAVAALRYVAQAHRVNGGACLHGKPWGKQWQSAMWARSLATGAWLLWDKLDRPTQLEVARLVEFEADRFLTQPPRSQLRDNTGAEENAWNAGLISLAYCMMPDHPRAKAWDQAAKRYLYNTFSIDSDKKDTSPGDDGRTVADWVNTVNAYPDLMLENHGLVHMGYLKNSHAMMFEAAASYILAGRESPKATLHHVKAVSDILLGCVSREGAPIYFGGNDWKLVHTQCSDVINFALGAVLLDDAWSARVAETSFHWLRRIQQQYQGCYTVRRDPEHNGLVASRLILCYLVFTRRGLGPTPVSQEELDRHITGTRLFKHGDAVIHQTPTKFVSFAWGSNRMALAMPQTDNWVVWPHYASYLGLVNGKNASRRAKAVVTRLKTDVRPDGFTVTGTLKRLGGRVMQDFAVASLKKDVVVYVERLQAKDGFRPDSRETGVIGHEYPLGENTRTLFGQFGQQEVVGAGNARAVRTLESDWLNVGGQVGYVVRREAGRNNLMRYHDESRGEGRVPKLQEWFSLVGDRDPAPLSGEGDWACVVTFLNQPPEQTARWAQQVRFTIDGDTATCRIGSDVVAVDFARGNTRVEEALSEGRKR